MGDLLKRLKAQRQLKGEIAAANYQAQTGENISGMKTGQKIRLERKLNKAKMQNFKRDLARTSKAKKDADDLAKLKLKKSKQAGKEIIRQDYSSVAHDKIDRLADYVHHAQDEMAQSKIKKSSVESASDRMKGYDSTADKKSKKRKHKELMQEQKGKHRFLLKKTDVHVNTDVDVRPAKNTGKLGVIFDRKRKQRPIEEIGNSGDTPRSNFPRIMPERRDP